MTATLFADRTDEALTAIEGEDWRRSPAEWSSSTVAFVRENDLSFVLELDDEPAFVREQRRGRDRLLAELERVQSSLDSFGVPFSLIKFPVVPKPIGDIDILVPSRVDRRNAFEDAGFRLQNRTEPHREAYVKEVDGELLTFDVHTRVSWRRVEYLDAARLVEQHTTHTLPGGTACPVPRPAHDLLVIAAHSMFDNGAVSLFEALYGHYLIEELDADLGVANDIADRYNWSPVFERFCDLAAAVGTGARTADPAAFPHCIPTGDVIGSRVGKTARDTRDGRLLTVGRELIGYPQDIVVHVFEERLGVSLVPFFRGVTAAKRRLTDTPR
jgi:hypothetical protein